MKIIVNEIRIRTSIKSPYKKVGTNQTKPQQYQSTQSKETGVETWTEPLRDCSCHNTSAINLGLDAI